MKVRQLPSSASGRRQSSTSIEVPMVNSPSAISPTHAYHNEPLLRGPPRESTLNVSVQITHAPTAPTMWHACTTMALTISAATPKSVAPSAQTVTPPSAGARALRPLQTTTPLQAPRLQGPPPLAAIKVGKQAVPILSSFDPRVLLLCLLLHKSGHLRKHSF